MDIEQGLKLSIFPLKQIVFFRKDYDNNLK